MRNAPFAFFFPFFTFDDFDDRCVIKTFFRGDFFFEVENEMDVVSFSRVVWCEKYFFSFLYGFLNIIERNM